MMRAGMSRYLEVDGVQLHIYEWGDAAKPAVLCWHGLTRNGRDFDTLAARLAKSFHVICPDMIGRGRSEWSADPAKDYCFGRYERLVAALVDALGIEEMRWVGTSMGGAIGIRLAGSILRNRITHLVLNDIGAGPAEKQPTGELAEGVQRILAYTANPPEFRTMTELMDYYRSTYRDFGINSEEEWLHFTETSARRKDNGKFTPDYDPQIVHQFAHPEDLLLREQWNAVKAKVLLIRGERSDILPVETAEAMRKSGPGCQLVTIPGLGHAPALNTEEQLTCIERFLNS
jgi:pimeloyl-ACP methyl ester carboxylesterase